ncbi:MAG TPA: GGDEF and EAL domain-containing protein [Acidobacteriaceae bacterium]|nr:GGDEF and EAL domain-containing protein [Acidobacteriaceae bacterium]
MPQEQSRECGEDWFRFARALEASQEGFWDWDLVADRLWGSSRWQSITGVTGPCSPLSAWIDRVHPYDKPRLEADLRAVQLGKSGAVRNEHRVRHGSGEWRWVTARGVVSHDESGRVAHVAGSLTDNTEARTADALTGLPNRIFFLDHLEARLERGRQRRDWDFAVLSVAIERFDRVNEALGSGGGDRLLLETAQRLQSLLLGPSVAARLNGAEFLVCLELVHSEAEATHFAEAVRVALRRPFVWRGQRLTPQLAIGIARADASYAHPEDLISDAESALAHARKEEPPGVMCYTHGMREKALERMHLEADLEKAIRAGELVMYYQPEVDLRTNRIVGFEALVRWRHERRGLLTPAEFIPLAEETGLILPLGDWGLGEACRQLVAWRKGGRAEMRGVRMSVNLSARQFEQPDLVQRVRRVLQESGLGPGALRLEVTESSLIADATSAVNTMRGLGELGVGLHMDDFGVGYSSLHNLQRFPFDTLKIDRSFVQGVVRDRESHQIVRNILDLAASFGMDVVAEGIEDAAQLEALKEMGCPCGQGYFFAKPMAPAGVDAMLQACGLGRQPALVLA